MSQPELSIIVAIQPHQGSSGHEALSSLAAQEGIESGVLEIIAVADQSRFDLRSAPETSAGALAVAARAGAASLPMLHGAGMAVARGNLIAITEGHCLFAPDWAARAITLHKNSEAPVISGSVQPGEKLSLLDWALFFCDYGQFLPPLAASPTNDLPGNNIIFKSAALADRSNFAKDGFWKTFYCHQLQEAGQSLLCEPGLVVRYNRRLSLPALALRRYHHGRCFGGMRAAACTFSRKMIYAFAAPVLPFLLIWKLCLRVLPKDKKYHAKFLLSLPFIIVCLVTWAFGESVGNLFGSGSSCEQL